MFPRAWGRLLPCFLVRFPSFDIFLRLLLFQRYANPEEEQTRFAAFVSNLAAADARNAAERATGVAGAAVHGITKFMDLTPEEFKHGYLNALARDAVTEKRAREAMPLAFSFAFQVSLFT
jgi:hypothetical protein